MNLSDYLQYAATGLAGLIRDGEVPAASPVASYCR